MSHGSKKPSPAAKKPSKTNQVTWAQCVRDVLIGAMNRGQLPILGCLAIIMLLIYKLPTEDCSKVVYQLLADLERGELYSYILVFLLAGGWFYHAKFMRKEFSDEALRIGKEKSAAQSAAAGERFLSSEKR